MTDQKHDSGQRLSDAFYSDLQAILQDNPGGLGEYELLQLLRERGYFSFLGDSPALPKEIFHAHFLLFHALYRFQQKLLLNQQGILEIGPLNIQLSPYRQVRDAVAQPDRLRDYYLDLTNLDGITEGDVHELLASFWREYIRFDNREAALAELGLSDPVDDMTIKQAYRRLAMQHHPDRGGDKQRLQAINEAYACLYKNRR